MKICSQNMKVILFLECFLCSSEVRSESKYIVGVKKEKFLLLFLASALGFLLEKQEKFVKGNTPR